jgi:hypothetical protein
MSLFVKDCDPRLFGIESVRGAVPKAALDFRACSAGFGL